MFRLLVLFSLLFPMSFGGRLAGQTTPNPERGKANCFLAMKEMDKQNYTEAVKLFSLALQNQFKSEAVYRERAAAYMKLENYALAAEDYTALFRLDTTNAAPIFDRAFAYIMMRRFDSARQDLDWLLAQYPKNARVHNLRAQCYRYDGNTEYKQAAFQAIEKAVELDPQNADHYMVRGLLLAREKQFDNALKDLTRAVETGLTKAPYYNARGLVRLDLSEPEAALRDFEMAVFYDPTDAYYFNNRGIARKQLNNLKGAIDDFSQALKLSPGHPYAYNNRGLVRLMQKDYYGAIADFQKNLKQPPVYRGLTPNFAAAYLNIATAYREMGRSQEACQYYDKAIVAGEYQAKKEKAAYCQ